MKELGKKLREQRKHIGKTQKEIGNEINCTENLIGKIERGERRIAKNKINLFAKAYNIDEQYIINNNYLESKKEKYKQEKIKICEKVNQKLKNILNDIKIIEDYIIIKEKELNKEIINLKKED